MSQIRVRHVTLEGVQQRLTARLKRIAGAYRLGNCTLTQALLEADKAFTKAYSEIIKYATKVSVKRDLGKDTEELNLDVLKQEITGKTQDYKSVLLDLRS